MTYKGNAGSDMTEHLSGIDEAYSGTKSQSQINAAMSNMASTGELNPGGYYDEGFNYAAGQMGMSPTQLESYMQNMDTSSGSQKAYQAQIAPASLAENYVDAKAYAPSLFQQIMGQVAMMSTIGAATAGIGGALAPGLDAALGTTAGSLGAGVANGALYGTIGGTLNSTFTGQNIGKGALEGGALGALGGGIGYGLNNDGLSSFENSAISKTGMGAVKGAINGQGAVGGAEGGALSAGEGAVQGSIFDGANTIFSGGNAANPTSDPSLTNPQAPGTMSDLNLYGLDDNPGNPNNYGSFDANNPLGSMTGYTGGAPVGYVGGVNLGSYGVGDPGLAGSNPGYDNLAVQGGGSTLGGFPSGVGSNGNLLGSLAQMLSGSSGGSISPSMLSQLLGMGSSVAGGALNSSAAKSAASTYQQEGMYNPYGTNTVNGSTSFNNGQMQSNLSPGAQQNVNGLNSLAQQNMSSLAGGTAGAANTYYNQMQQQQKMGNSQYMGANLDNQFANGIMSSTAGQYQTGAALNNLNNTNMQDQTQAQNFANTQQQNQLSQLTGSLNGLQGYNTSQLNAGQLGAQMGTGQSNANNVADQPWLAANSNSNVGNLLTSLGSSAASPYTNSGGY